MSEKGRPSMQQVHPASLMDLTGRISYLKSFPQFTNEDGAAIRSAKPLIAPLLPTILDIIYAHLLSYDITAKAFVPRQPGQSSNAPVPQSAIELSLDHPSIKHRKDFLKNYLVRMVSNGDWEDNSNYWEYLDRVGIMHTGQPGFKHRQNRPELRVEYVHMGLLLRFVEDVVVKAVIEADLDADTKMKLVRAFNKLLWIQNDLFARHFIVDKDSGVSPEGIEVHQVYSHLEAGGNRKLTSRDSKDSRG